MSSASSFRAFSSNITYSGKTSPAADPSRNNTDVIAPEFKLYIEGVQVPFESISISQTYGGKPTANIQIPPQSGLLDITRGYDPKVHIFYKDDNYGGDRLLFWGIIKSSSYGRSRQAGSTYITFSCEHKNSVMDQLTLDFAGWASNTNQSQVDNNDNSALKVPAFNSASMLITGMAGMNGLASAEEAITPTNPDILNAPVDKLDYDLTKMEKRFFGMPGVAMNLWNQLKKDCYVKKFDNLAMSKMYVPLVEHGISYFKRMSGHYFLEQKLQGSKRAYCNQIDGKLTEIVIPPYARNSMISAVQAEMTIRNISNMVGFSGELISFEGMIYNVLGASKYDVLTLASPAEIHVDPNVYVDKVAEDGVEKCAIETIIKPQVPFYFSPTCNVVLPRMYMSLQINQDESGVPTRISATHDALPMVNASSGLGTSFKGPPSYREAVAYASLLHGITGRDKTLNLDLDGTKGYSWFIPSKYEQGTGIKHEKIALPWWLAILASDKASQGPTANQEVFPEKGTVAYDAMIAMSAEWKSRYGRNIVMNDADIKVQAESTKDGLNPYDPLNKSVMPYERIMFATVDYEYSQRYASSRNGNVEMVFNPYIIPGYPMDIIDESPNHPSFHAFCTSVTHSITSRSVTTNVSMINVVSYAELSNYYTPPLSPFLQTSLDLVNAEFDIERYNNDAFGSTKPVISTASTLLQNPVGKRSADEFYRQVLGVGAVAPDDLIHFTTNRAYPLERKAGILTSKVLAGQDNLPNIKNHAHQARETDDYYSTVGNLRLVARPIESKDSIKSKFSYNFIDLDPVLYNDAFINYVNPILAQDLYLEPGASLFLDYMEVKDFIKG